MQTRSSANFLFIDFSSLQTIVDQNLLISKLQGKAAYLRAYGSSHTAADTTFVTRAQLLQANGIPSGGYYFATPTTDPAVSTSEIDAQCDQFIAILQQAYGTGKYGSMIPILDVEAWDTTTPQKPMYYGLTGTMLVNWILHFRDRFFASTGRTLGLYSDRYFLTDPTMMNINGTDLAKLSSMPLWLAEYDKWYPANAPMTNGVWSGGVTTATLEINKDYTGAANDGEIHVNTSTGSQVIHPDGFVFNLVSLNNDILTHLESTATGTFQIMYVGTDWSRFGQLTAGSQSHDFVVVAYDSVAATWKYYPNSATGYAFTPNNNDCLIGEISKTVTSGGIQSLTLYTPPAPANLGGWTTYEAWQYADTGVASDWGLSHATNQVDLNRTDSLSRILAENTGSLAVKVAFGTTLKKGSAVIAGLTTIDGLSVSADNLEVTTFDNSVDDYRVFKGSLKDAGELSLSGYFGYSDHNALLADFESGLTNSYTIEFPKDAGLTTGITWNFSGIVTAFSTSAGLEDLVSFDATIKLSGKPTLLGPV